MPVASAANPFFQPARQWQIRVRVPKDDVALIEEAFGDLALAILSFEVDEAAAQWAVDIVTDVPPEKADVTARLAFASGLENKPTPSCEVKLLEPKDWVSEVERGFPPISVGRFYIHGSHAAEPPPHGKIALVVNAGAAFGSGEHATTSGCLRALGLLARKHRFHRPLDMGCGSGILAIAMAKLFKTRVLGIDIDPVSVAVARGNAGINRTHALTRFYAGDGYNHESVRKHAPFDLILANILARPLMRMAPDLARALERGGIAVLSGLLDLQERMVLAAHRAQGLQFKARITQGSWQTLILRKPYKE